MIYHNNRMCFIRTEELIAIKKKINLQKFNDKQEREKKS